MTAARIAIGHRHGLVVVTLPIRTLSEPNVRSHWAEKAKRTASNRTVVALALRPHVRAMGLPVVVELTRLSSGTLDDDNLRGALKAVRDGVADALGLRDDSDEKRVSFDYRQRLVKRGTYGVEISVRPRRARARAS